MLLVAAGLSNEYVARMLFISARTVDRHLATMLRRADAANRAELVARCYAAGILRHSVWPPTWSGTRCLAITAANASHASAWPTGQSGAVTAISVNARPCECRRETR